MLQTAPAPEASEWLASFSRQLASGDAGAVLELFAEDCYWRDFVAFTWNVKTMEGKPAIKAMLDTTLAATAPTGFALSSVSGQPGNVEGWFDFETAVGRGQGIFRLEGGKCRTILTTLQELKGFEEGLGPTRPKGVRHGADRNRQTWSERRAVEDAELGASRQPYCLIIGGGQGGIMLGARLKQLGVPFVIAEKNAKAGDSWRKRYRSLVLHDPVWYDHLPYIPFPQHWPVFTPKDKMGDWLEMYVKVMELNYWGSTEVKSASYDPAAKLWTVELLRDGKPVTLQPAQIVFATGAYGPPRYLELPGAADFKCEILHSSQYSDGSKYKGKKVAVIGAASSGHDVSVDLWEAGADVTMVQRSPTTVVRSETLMELAFDTYSEAANAAGIDVDKADMMAAATPFALQPPVQRALYEKIRVRDADFYKRLEDSGFLIDFGEDETLRNILAFLEGNLDELAVDLRLHRHGFERLHRTDAVKINRNVGALRFADEHRHRAGQPAAAAALARGRVLRGLAALHVDRGAKRQQKDGEQAVNDIAAVFAHFLCRHGFGPGTGMPSHKYPLVAAAISASAGGQPPPSA